MGNMGFWEILDGKGPDTPKNLPGKKLATSVPGNPSKGSCLLPRQELSHGDIETKEKVLLVRMKPSLEKEMPRPGHDILEVSIPLPTHPTSSEPGWADGRTRQYRTMGPHQMAVEI